MLVVMVVLLGDVGPDGAGTPAIGKARVTFSYLVLASPEVTGNFLLTLAMDPNF